MSKIATKKIPSLDLSAFRSGSESERKNFSEALGEGFGEIGFVTITSHGLDSGVTNSLYKELEKFFSLPPQIKNRYEIEGIFGQRGYIGKGKERAKGRKIGDLKEFFHVGQPIEDSLKSYPENIWPSEFPEFEHLALSTFKTLELIGIDLLRAISLYLNMPEHYFTNQVKKGNSILRAIHYFPLNQSEIPTDAVRAAAHGDINLITILMGASADGLQIQTKEGDWVSVTAPPDHLVVNVGDMLSRLTNNKLKSTIHRVINPDKSKMNTSRYSIPFFMHPVSSMPLNCLSNCIDNKNPKMFEDITAGEFLDQRLKEIGLKA